MTLNNSQKALAITFLIIGTLILSLINMTALKMNTDKRETGYETEMVAEVMTDDVEEATEEDLAPQENSQSTNKAFNKSENFEHYADAYKPIAPPEDYTNPKLETYKNSIEEDQSSEKTTGNSSISEKTLTDFNSVNEILNKRSQSKNSKQSNLANTNSSIYYSLEGRSDRSLPIPIYLCDAKGKIVVNITVNNNGTVVNASISKSSTSKNACLKEHALEYAKEAKFDNSSKPKQTGSITFEFKGK
ncbi:energy transducer TonB [Psychroserpens sp. NJDZ02]|uniref:energy transducer TonB family protein n=1 Tax=Psychroserpens sp. NJDZ02 TaxID=2570561 RepID=UPI0010A79E0B|nr:energy transducer TonB [Psychroserpens sp. NJDZ02]QCE40861.1 TonB family protein [Psychroserpens sp. NJDZ02]